MTGAFSTYVPLGSDGSQVNLVVDPNQAGPNQVHAYLIDPSGRPADWARASGSCSRFPIKRSGRSSGNRSSPHGPLSPHWP